MAPRKRVELSPDITRADLELFNRLRKAVQEKREREEKTKYVDRRNTLLAECPHPLLLAQKLDPTVVATPAMEHISKCWRDTIKKWNGRLTVSLGTQQGKSQLSRWAIFWALLDNPNRRVVFASYGMRLARTSGRMIRGMVVQYGEHYGLVLDQSHHDAADWQLASPDGGSFAGGVLSASIDSMLTGRPSDLLVMDDLLAGEAEANSPVVRANVDTWWESTARTRMAPGTAAVAIGTRWSEFDILSRFIGEGWDRINIPAVADGQTLDSVGHLPGARTEDGYLISTRGTTPDDWDLTRRESGERVWAAIFQGRPAPLEGGIFKRADLDAHRVDRLPEQLSAVIVGCDPADTGKGDEAGILVAARGLNGHLYVVADMSGKLSEAQWSRRACIAWITYDANRILQERNTGFSNSIFEAWQILRRQATALVGYGSVEKASLVLQDGGDIVAANEASLREIEDIAEKIVDSTSSGPRVVHQTPRRQKIARAETAARAFETGRAHIVGTLPRVEHECVTLVEDYRESPARVDVLSMLVIDLDAQKRSALIV